MKKKLSVVVVSGAFLIGVVTFATAGSLMANTPLYTVRMEQASSEMSFLPTEMNGFTYTTEKGSTVNSCANAQYCGGVELLDTLGHTYCGTCWPQCSTSEATCEGSYTCYYTCIGDTCPIITCMTCEGQGNTCDATSCQETCSTCTQPTCSTCNGWTCDPTGCQNTCYTCDRTCWDTCEGNTCWPPCP